MRKLSWFQQRRFDAAINHINTKGELSFDEVLARVSGFVSADRHTVVHALAYAIAEGKITVRYDAIKDGCFVESQTSVTAFGPDVDIFEDVEAVYTKAAA